MFSLRIQDPQSAHKENFELTLTRSILKEISCKNFGAVFMSESCVVVSNSFCSTVASRVSFPGSAKIKLSLLCTNKFIVDVCDAHATARGTAM